MLQYGGRHRRFATERKNALEFLRYVRGAPSLPCHSLWIAAFFFRCGRRYDMNLPGSNSRTVTAAPGGSPTI